MDLSEILAPSLCFVNTEGRSQKRIFETIAEQISEQHSDLSYSEIFDALSARERLGSTGLGEGVAIPHCRLNYQGAGIAAVVALIEPVDWDAPDQKPVDLLVFLMVSGDANQAHLDTLANLARILSDEGNRSAMRKAKDGTELCKLLLNKAA